MMLTVVRGSTSCKQQDRARSASLYVTFTFFLPSLLSSYLTEKGNGLSEISLTNSTDISRLTALLTASPHPVTLDETEKEWLLKNKTLLFKGVKSRVRMWLYLLTGEISQIWPGSCRAWPRTSVWLIHVHRCQRTEKQSFLLEIWGSLL